MIAQRHSVHYAYGKQIATITSSRPGGHLTFFNDTMVPGMLRWCIYLWLLQGDEVILFTTA